MLSLIAVGRIVELLYNRNKKNKYLFRPTEEHHEQPRHFLTPKYKQDPNPCLDRRPFFCCFLTPSTLNCLSPVFQIKKGEGLRREQSSNVNCSVQKCLHRDIGVLQLPEIILGTHNCLVPRDCNDAAIKLTICIGLCNSG